MTLTEETETLLEAAALAAVEAQAEQPVAFDVTQSLPFSDAFLILTADNPRHLRGVSAAVQDLLHEKYGATCAVEGDETSEWLLLDYGELLIHIFLPEAREFYALDRLWNQSPQVDLGQIAQAS